MLPLLALLLAPLADAAAPLWFHHRVELHTTTKVPVFGRTRVVTTSHLLARYTPVAGQPGRYQVEEHTCAISMVDDSSIADTTVGPGFAGGMPVRRYEAMVGPDDEGRTVFRALTPVMEVGYTLEGDDSFPTADDDPRIVDWDDDGHPGASLDLKVPIFGRQKVFILQAGQNDYRGAWVDGGVPQGRITLPVMHHKVIGATSGLFNLQPKVGVDEEASHFSLTPVPAGTTCAEVAAGVAPEG